MSKARPLFPEFAGMLKAALGDIVDPAAVDFLDLMAEDAVMEFPFALPGGPQKVEGRAQLEAYLRPLDGLLAIESHTGPTVHRSTNPNVVILEFSVKGRVVSNGLLYDQTYISVLTLKDGKIANFRDYWNPLVTQRLVASGSEIANVNEG
ncbi:TPA: nuclear transport factor 2 family protein [Burkholderia cenocepacia]|nr:nuclear transport factor 2 family protein [Burkholderia cenocepacia]HDR9888529.1 nuclear transport factor 2 family protein [Burkholderia cenocepacia]